MTGSLAAAIAGWSCAVGLAVAGGLLEGSRPRLALGLLVGALGLATAVAAVLLAVERKGSAARREAAATRRVARSPLARLAQFAGPEPEWPAGPALWWVTPLPGRTETRTRFAAAGERHISLVGRTQPVPLQLSRRLKDGADWHRRQLA